MYQGSEKCVPKWGSTPNHFVMGFLKKLWTIHVVMGVSESVGSDVPNLLKYVPNFVKDVRNFVNDVPRVRKCVPNGGSTPNHFVMGFLKKLWTIHVEIGVSESVGSEIGRASCRERV